ncbi:hypothetical protein HPB50_007759 [Hyalomma asiaticum]|uniref:Uncharacterized protein n=1 Tax=Hyalomma asiaticum TaxID=266040 RepID=A0ACB7SWT5_HYAAI|nr:hypothetical protein HPB50_007759 [Hyalomma asiaticum]
MAPVASWTPSKALVFAIVAPTGTSPETVVDATASIVGLSEVYACNIRELRTSKLQLRAWAPWLSSSTLATW